MTGLDGDDVFANVAAAVVDGDWHSAVGWISALYGYAMWAMRVTGE